MDRLLRLRAADVMLRCEGIERLLVSQGEHQLLPRRPELARRPVERRERDLLQHSLEVAGLSPFAFLARIRDRGRLVRPAAERDVRNNDRRHRRECDQDGRCPSHSCSPRESPTGTSATSARRAASKKGVENASVTARSS